MLAVVFPQDFNLAAKVVVGALDQLVLTRVLVLLNVLTQDSSAALVITLNDFEQTPFIVQLQILVHDHRPTSLIWTHNPSEEAVCLVCLQVFSLESSTASIFKQALSLVWAVHYLE